MVLNSKEKIFKSKCWICHIGCSVLVHVRDGNVYKVEGDPDFPTNRGMICSQARQLDNHFCIDYTRN